MNKPTFSLVLPFYKQETYIQEVIHELGTRLADLGESFELIVVINGISDLPMDWQKAVISENPLIKELKLRQAGWGRAVRYGLTQAEGKYLCYTNTARTNVDELIKMLRYAILDDQVVTKAVRILRENNLRKWISIFYNLESWLILRTPIWDVNATPKIIPRNILEKIELTSNGDLIDAELMYKCFLNAIPVVEVPVRGVARRDGKTTTNLYSALKMFWGIFQIKIKNLYDKKTNIKKQVLENTN